MWKRITVSRRHNCQSCNKTVADLQRSTGLYVCMREWKCIMYLKQLLFYISTYICTYVIMEIQVFNEN